MVRVEQFANMGVVPRPIKCPRRASATQGWFKRGRWVHSQMDPKNLKYQGVLEFCSEASPVAISNLIRKRWNGYLHPDLQISQKMIIPQLVDQIRKSNHAMKSVNPLWHHSWQNSRGKVNFSLSCKWIVAVEYRLLPVLLTSRRCFPGSSCHGLPRLTIIVDYECVEPGY